MSRLTAELVVSLLDRVSRPARAIESRMGRLRDAAACNAREMNAMRGRMLDAVGAGYVLAKAISSPIKAAMEFESAMADVRKVVDFETPEAFKKMSTDILAMSKRIAMSATGLAAITAAAGQAGMAGAELLQFTELAAKAAVAFDIPAATAGESLAKIKTALGLTVEETELLADAFNHLSNNSAASAPDIMNYMRRVATVGEQYGFTAEQTAAIGAAMIAAGAEANVAATSFRNVGRALTRGASASKAQKRAFAALGLSATEVAKRMQEDAVGTLNDVLARIRALPKHLQAAAISDLFGDEARALAPLIDNTELMAKALGLVADSADYAGSATEEYAVRAETAENKLQLFRNKVQALAITIGDALLPALTGIIEALGPIVDAIATWATANPKLVAGLIAVAASLVGLKIVTIATRWAFLFLKGGMLDVGIAAGRSAGLIVSAMKRMRLAMLGAHMLTALGGGGGLLTGLVSGLAGAVPMLTGAATAVGTAIAGITAPVWALVAAVAAVGIAVWHYWEPISNFVVGFAEGIYGAVEPLITFLSEAAGRIAKAVGSWIVDRVVDIAALLGFDPATVRAAIDDAVAAVVGFGDRAIELVKAIPGRIGNWISEIFTMKDYSDEAEAGFREAGRRAGKAMVEAIKQGFLDLIEWFKSLPDKIIAAIGKIDIRKLIPRLSISDFWGGGDAPAVDGARAAGGPVAGGRTYLVGERGPELFTPDRSGSIVPNHALAGGEARARPSSPLSVSFGDIHVHGASDVDSIVAELESRLRDALDGLQADLEYAVA